MLEGPGPDVFPKRLVEEIGAHHVISERQQYQRRFSIADRAKCARIDVVRRGHEWRLRSAGSCIRPVSQIERICALAGITRLVGKRIQVGVDPLVHPRIASLVGADDHREPFMSVLVIDRPEDGCRIVTTVVHHHEHRILHTADAAGHTRRLRIRKWIEQLRILPDRPLRLLGGLLPGFAGLREFIVGLH